MQILEQDRHLLDDFCIVTPSSPPHFHLTTIKTAFSDLSVHLSEQNISASRNSIKSFGINLLSISFQAFLPIEKNSTYRSFIKLSSGSYILNPTLVICSTSALLQLQPDSASQIKLSRSQAAGHHKHVPPTSIIILILSSKPTLNWAQHKPILWGPQSARVDTTKTEPPH